MIITEFLAYIRMRKIIRFLQSPKGCEWDRAQTPTSLQPHLQEEVEELIAEIERNPRDTAHLIEELGDVILVLNLLVHSFRQEKEINMKHVYTRLTRKLIFRHPHVFRRKHKRARDKYTNRAHHQGYWEEMKQLEKKENVADRKD